MALPSFSAAVARVAVTVNNIWTPPWSGLSHILFGPESSSSSRTRRSARRHRRSRSCPRVPSAIRSSIPPPHSYVFRGRESSDTTGAPGQASYPPFFFQSGAYDRAFGYSILDRGTDSRSSGRSSHRSRCPLEDDREKNFLSALLSILVIATLATALTQPKWFSVRGGVCGRKFIGLQLFIEFGPHAPGTHSASGRNEPLPVPLSVFEHPSYLGATYLQYADSRNQKESHVEDVDDEQVINSLPNSTIKSAVPKTGSGTVNATSHPETDTHRSSTAKKWSAVAGHVKKTCSFSDILPLQRGIILFSLMAIVANLVQFFLDTLGTSKKWLDSVRIYALGSIFGVIFTIFIIGISYMIATIIEVNEKSLIAASTKEPVEPSHLEVRFELSYYLVTLSGLIGLLAAACNLLRKPTMYFLTSADGRNPLIDFYPRTTSATDEPLSPIWSGTFPGGASVVLPPVPPPPPYTP